VSREAFDNWWSDFQAAHEEWKYADREAILYAAYGARQPEIDNLRAALARLLAASKKGNADTHHDGCRCVFHEARSALAE
jgi:hypothetical protein